jgi:hypothetical protein
MKSIKKKLIKLVSYLFNKHIVVEKIAFYVNELYIFDHYKNVMECLPQDGFIIILSEKFRGESYQNLISLICNNCWDYCYIEDVFYRYKFRLLVTHFYFGGDSSETGSFLSRLQYLSRKVIGICYRKIGMKRLGITTEGQYFQKILGIYNIGFMYGLDNGKASFGGRANIVDIFFCHGPFDEKIISDLYNKPTFIMGYPRYDKFLLSIDNNNLKTEMRFKFRCDLNKSTILWICTVTEAFSTILTYANEMEILSSEYNIIVRPHPLEISRDSNRFNEKVFETVHKSCFILSDDSSQEMSELYMIADFVVCDYGGSVFSALYLGKRIILLNNKNFIKDPEINVESTLEIRKIIPGISDDNPIHLSEIIRDKNYWKRNDSLTEAAKKFFFGEVEIASPRTAVKIMQLFSEAQQANHI